MPRGTRWHILSGMKPRFGSISSRIDGLGRRVLTTQRLAGVVQRAAAPSALFTIVTLLALILAGWTATFPGGHALRYPIWIVAATLITVWYGVAARYILRTPQRGARFLAATMAAVFGIGLLAVSEMDLVRVRWTMAEDSFHRMALALLVHPDAARARPGERIAGYAISKVTIDDNRGNVYFETSGTGLGCGNGGFAYLSSFANRAHADHDDYRQLNDHWYYWVPRPTACHR